MKDQPWLELGDWITEQALGDYELETVFRQLMERLEPAGISINRSNLAMASLHPMFRSLNLTWHRSGGTRLDHQSRGEKASAEWQESPLRALLEGQDEERVFNFRLDRPGDWERFPFLKTLRDEGATEYLAQLVGFREPRMARELSDGMILSWTSDREGGFSSVDRETIAYLTPRLGLAAKLSKREQTTENIVSAYLGSDSGRRVLNGQIRRGDMDVIHAVIWYSDLRDSTQLAESMTGPNFLSMLNEYFECTAGAVLDHGGEVLCFIGDAVLAIFPVTGTEGQRRWTRVALAAAQSARERLREVSAARVHRGERSFRFGLALHVGDVYFGNIGVAERLQFSVIGSAANQVARLESLTKQLGEEVIVSGDLARELPLAWRKLGRHPLRGLEKTVEIFAPPENSTERGR